MGYDTKPNLDNSKFEQRTADILNLSGTTNIINSFSIESGSTFYIKTSGTTGRVLTYTPGGLAEWKPTTIGVFANNNLYTCMSSLTGLTSASNNIFIGVKTGNKTTCGFDNIILGCCSFRNNSSGCYNTAFNTQSLGNNTCGCHNMAIGYRSMCLNTVGSNNVALGHCAGFSNITGSSNVYIGKCAGFNELGSCKLHIGICSTESLVCGDFSTKQLKICGGLAVTGVESRSGETNLLFYNQSNGKITYATANADNISITPVSPFTGTTVQQISDEYANALSSVSVNVSNGLSKSGGNIVLGGTLTGDTTIDINNNNFVLSNGYLKISELSGTTSRMVQANPKR